MSRLGSWLMASHRPRRQGHSDPDAAVRIDVDIVRRALPAGLLVSGLVYDTDTGLIEFVVAPTT